MSKKFKLKEYKRTKTGLVAKIYDGQKTRSKNRGHRMPEYTKEALQEWLYSQTLFHTLYEEWVYSGFTKDLIPSVDRKIDAVHYCFNNIELMTWEENNKNGAKSRQIIINKYSKDGDYICEYLSLTNASADTKVNIGHISSVCKGNRKSAGGFIWKYKLGDIK